MDHVKALRKQHPSKQLKEVLQMAAKTYNKGSGASTKKVVGKKATKKKGSTAKKGKSAKKGKGKGKTAKKGKKSKSSGRK